VNALFVITVIATYVVVGALYARSQTVAVWQRAYAELRKNTTHTWYRDLAAEWEARDRRWADESLLPMLAWRVAFWPYAIVFDALRGPVKNWLVAPVADRRTKAAQLRADAKSWDELRHNGTPVEQAMAADLARLCREWAKDLDL
jgi:hypothetical protein